MEETTPPREPSDTPPLALATERLEAWAPVYDDGPAVHALLSDADLLRYTPDRPSASLAATRYKVATWRGARAEGLLTFAFAAKSRRDDALGIVQVELASGEVGAIVSPNAARQGYVAEMFTALLAQLQPHLRGVPFAVCDAGNAEAMYILGKSSFRVRTDLPRFRVHPALGPEPRDCVRWSRPSA